MQKVQHNNENSFTEGQKMGETQPSMVYMKSCHAGIYQAGCGPQSHTSGSWQSLDETLDLQLGKNSLNTNFFCPSSTS